MYECNNISWTIGRVKGLKYRILKSWPSAIMHHLHRRGLIVCTRRVEMRNHVGKDVRSWVPHGQVLHTVLQQMHSLGYHGHGVDEHHVLFGVEIVRNSVSVEIRPCFVSWKTKMSVMESPWLSSCCILILILWRKCLIVHVVWIYMSKSSGLFNTLQLLTKKRTRSKKPLDTPSGRYFLNFE